MVTHPLGIDNRSLQTDPPPAGQTGRSRNAGLGIRSVPILHHLDITDGSAVVGSFLSLVMIRSNRKKAAKRQAVEKGKKKA
ncbi:MAG: hypothetical protein Q9195_004435 [Heterodermia aff. obscurata]